MCLNWNKIKHPDFHLFAEPSVPKPLNRPLTRTPGITARWRTAWLSRPPKRARTASSSRPTQASSSRPSCFGTCAGPTSSFKSSPPTTTEQGSAAALKWWWVTREVVVVGGWCSKQLPAQQVEQQLILMWCEPWISSTPRMSSVYPVWIYRKKLQNTLCANC